jgi:hypothetical protein
MSTVSLYNHTSSYVMDLDLDGFSYYLMLCASSTFDATDATLADITKTEVADGNGYTTGGQELMNKAITTVNTNNAKFLADDVEWPVTSGSITADSAILYYSNGNTNPPLLHIDFGASIEVSSGSSFLIEWDPDGIIVLDTP